jgi:hypothetical protein
MTSQCVAVNGRSNRYGTRSRREYQRLYQRDYQKHIREARAKCKPDELTDRMFQFCKYAIDEGIIKITSEEAQLVYG